MTLLARLGPRPKTLCTTPAYPRLLALAAVAVLGACGGVVTSPNQEGTSASKTTPDTTTPELGTGGAAGVGGSMAASGGGTGVAPYEPSPDPGPGGAMGTGGSMPTESGGMGGAPYVPPPPSGDGAAAPFPYLVPEAGVVIPTEAAPPSDPDAGSPNPAGGEPVTFDAGVLAD
jgi:hypothetical protein